MSGFNRAVAVAAAFTLGFGGQALAQGPTTPPSAKVAIVNSRVLLEGAPGRALAERTLEQELTTYQAEVKRMQDSLDAMVADYQKVEATLSPAVREQRQKAIATKRDSFAARKDTLEDKAARRQQELIQPVLDLVKKVLDEVRAEDGYAVIFDIGAEAQPIVAYDKNLDITDRVSARVKRQPAPTLPIGNASGSAGVRRQLPPR